MSRTANASLLIIRQGQFRMLKASEWLGTGLGALGALMLAANMSWSAYGWLVFLLSNIAWIIFAVIEKMKSMLLMQLVFTATSLIGIYRWLV